MKVKFLKPCLGFLASTGNIKDIDKGLAVCLIQRGIAESVADTKVEAARKAGRPKKNKSDS